MKTNLLLLTVAFAFFAACNQNLSPDNESEGPAELSIGFEQMTKASSLAENESKVSGIQVFVFRGDVIDAYKKASQDEISSKKVSIRCTQGVREIWAVVNAPDLSGVYTLSALKNSVSLLSEHNGQDNFVMVGRLENEKISALHSTVVPVDRLVARIRLFQLKRDMSNSGLQNASFKVNRIYLTDVVGNACYDIFTPSVPESITMLNATGSNMEKDNPFVYCAARQTSEISDGGYYGTPYEDSETVATHNFYVYPDSSGSTRVVVEVEIDGKLYTYPVPVGKTLSNKSYDIRMLTVTRPGNPSDGDDEIDPGENEDIVTTSATFSVTVNDWVSVLTFGGENGVVDGKIEI